MTIAEVQTGLDQLVTGLVPDILRRARIVYVGHAAAMSWRLIDGVKEIRRAGLQLVGVIAPEHGYSGAGQAGVSDPNGIADGIPQFDGYGRGVEEISEWLLHVRAEALLVDFCDVGARCWTYLATMQDSLLASSRIGRPVVILDRPNPLGGIVAAGPMLEPAYESYVGRAHVPLRHSLTLGELAIEMQRRSPEIELQLVRVRGWRRSDTFGDYGRTWIPPSPNIPTWETALAYPGTVLFEGTNISEGRGTTRPFLTLGAPFADEKWAETIRLAEVDGVAVRATHYVPTFGRYVGQRLLGVGLHVLNPTSFDPLRFAIVALTTAFELYREHITIVPGVFDALVGTAMLREHLERGETPDDICASWTCGEEEFQRERVALLCY